MCPLDLFSYIYKSHLTYEFFMCSFQNSYDSLWYLIYGFLFYLNSKGMNVSCLYLQRGVLSNFSQIVPKVCPISFQTNSLGVSVSSLCYLLCCALNSVGGAVSEQTHAHSHTLLFLCSGVDCDGLYLSVHPGMFGLQDMPPVS